MNNQIIKRISLLIILTLIFSCKTNSEKQIIESFYDAYNEKNYKKIKSLLSKDVELFEMGYLVLNTRNDFIDIIKWGEILNAKTELKRLYFIDGYWLCDEIQKSDRISFLYQEDIIAKSKISIIKGKIIKIESDLISFNSEKYNNKKQKFINWIRSNHPELLMKLNFLNKEGAETYKSAMRLYESNISK